MKSRATASTILLSLLLTPAASHAIITFTQLGDDTFVVSHRIKAFGSRAKAMRMVHTKAASLCIAAGYSHMEVLDTESQAANEWEDANASITVQLHADAGDGRLDCDTNADPEYIRQASEQLARKGYVPPDAADESGAEEGETQGAGEGQACSIEQIVDMVETGLTVDQIEAACPVGVCSER